MLTHPVRGDEASELLRTGHTATKRPTGIIEYMIDFKRFLYPDTNAINAWFTTGQSFVGGRPVHTSEAGYNLAAVYYDSWSWQKVWAAVEKPLIESFLERNQNEVCRAADFGAGTGNNLYALADRFPSCTIDAYDISKKMLRRCAAKKIPNVNLYCNAIEELDKPYKYDMVLMNRVLSHIRDKSNIIKLIGASLTENGQAIITDIDSDHKYTHTRLPARNGKIDVETHKVDRHEIVEMFREHNLTLLDQVTVFSNDMGLRYVGKLPSSISIYQPRPLLNAFLIQKISHRH